MQDKGIRKLKKYFFNSQLYKTKWYYQKPYSSFFRYWFNKVKN